MAIIVNDNLDVRAPKLTDRRSGPFATVSAALAAINVNARANGLTVIIGLGDTQKEYWFKGGELVAKTYSGADLPPDVEPGEDGSFFQVVYADENGYLII